MYCTSGPRWFRWTLLIGSIAAVTSIVIVLVVVGYTKASKAILLSFFLAQYLEIFIAYLITFSSGTFPLVKNLFLWNMGLCCVAWIGALASLIAHLKGQLDFITLLWVSTWPTKSSKEAFLIR
jgi:hypothetical protein